MRIVPSPHIAPNVVASTTRTVKHALDSLPRESFEVQVTTVSPIGKTPDFEHVAFARGPSTASAAVTGP